MTFVRQKWTQLHTVLAIFGVILGWAIVPIGIKSCTKETLVQSQAPVWEALGELEKFQDAAALKLKSKDELAKTIGELGRTQAGLELKLKTLEAVEAERARLETLLKMQANSRDLAGYEAKVARVINRDINGWWQQIWIDLGSAQGVKSGAGVVARFGVVGRVREVYEQTSVVELISSPRFRMAAQMQGDDRPFVFQGAGLRFAAAPLGVVQALQPEMALKPGEIKAISTTGFSGSFPAGLPIGLLTDTGGFSEGGLLEGHVRLPAQLQSIKEVSVLLPYR